MTHATCATHGSYQLSCEEYDALVAIRPGQCHWCGSVGRKLEIDHDHALGAWAVRGLLCRRCNKCIQLVQDGIHPRTEAAERYLAEAWHMRQSSSEGKKLRAKPRGECALCGFRFAMRSDGRPVPHWWRFGRADQRCIGSTLPSNADPWLVPDLRQRAVGAAVEGVDLNAYVIQSLEYLVGDRDEPPPRPAEQQ